MTEYILCFILFCIGLYCIVVKQNLVKMIIGLSIMGYAVNLFFILVGYVHKGHFPILSKENLSQLTTHNSELIMVDPIPQALVLTAIVISLAVICLMVAIALRIYEKYGSYDIKELRRLKV